MKLDAHDNWSLAIISTILFFALIELTSNDEQNNESEFVEEIPITYEIDLMDEDGIAHGRTGVMVDGVIQVKLAK